MHADTKPEFNRRNLAKLERIAASWLQNRTRQRRNAGHLTYWAIYPLTLLEAGLMAAVAVLAHGLWRLVYCKAWFPESARQPPRRLIKQQINAEDALGAMRTLERIGRESGAQLFWISGTLLGLARMGRPLPHDNDLDLGICIDDAHYLEFIRAMWVSGDVVSMKPQRISWMTRLQNPDLQDIPGGIIRFKSVVRSADAPGNPAIKTDIFMHFPYGGEWMHGSRNTLWCNTPLATVRNYYGEHAFSVPEDQHLYLAENYGNYREEVKDFENSIDCPNARNIFSWRSLAYLLSRQQAMLKRGRVDRAHQINMRIKATLLKGVLPLFMRQR